MARKTFISYKYSEARGTRDKIYEALGENARYYRGETSLSPDLTDTTTENIKSKLADKMSQTSVTIVVISPNMKDSVWISWEIEYCLKSITRMGRVSSTNGVVGVIQKVAGGYDWLVSKSDNDDGCKNIRTIDSNYLYPIINKNRFNLLPQHQKYMCARCKTVDQLTGSYISLIEEHQFLATPDKYIENAYQKSEVCENFELVKQRADRLN